MAGNRLANAADSWSRGVSGAGGRWTDGVNGVTESPTQAAIRAKPRMVQGFNDAMNDGRYEAGCNRVTTQSWQKSCKDKAGNFTQSATTKKPKYAQYIQQAGPTITNIQQQAKQMPGDTLQQRIEKANFVMREMAAIKGKFRAS